MTVQANESVPYIEELVRQFTSQMHALSGATEDQSSLI